ncbi:MAG: UDP-N-acetylmuramoyl-L-alanyl-D-glutamate--2,6-diaminopimelate ligase [Clostridiales bacterium]|nr:UDP-N-acetylmuramoyl-L-alanyl-D-glutamate--2,6-diaminopimelate ligase [Clostridiales bacterium]
MLLSDILRELDYRVISGDPDVEVTSVEFDSRRVHEGSVFVCIKGFKTDGHKFVASAAENGAACVIVEAGREGFGEDELKGILGGTSCVLAEAADTKKALALIAATLEGHPERDIAVYGFTGTKGKTTSTFMLRNMFEVSGKGSGLIGTVCNIIGDERIEAVHTTPESSKVFGMMRSLREKNIKNLVMEVSSQGLKLDRVYGLRYRAAAFTNLYEDHISPEEHPDMEDYLNCKLKIFDSCDNAVINADCEPASRVIDYASSRCNVLTYGIEAEADFRAENLRPERKGHVTGTTFNVSGRYVSGEFFVALPGKFNVYNALCAIAMAYCAGISEGDIRKVLESISVPGRMQPVENTLGLNILVDYAHNAEALKSAITTLKEYTAGRVITLFGCGGDRPKIRRFEMGEVSGNLSDYTVITSDNPRTEEPAAIIGDILTGINKTTGKYEVEADRTTAIKLAISMAKPGDTVLIAGKGHEDYQEINGVKHHFDDAEKAYEAVKELGGAV